MRLSFLAVAAYATGAFAFPSMMMESLGKRDYVAQGGCTTSKKCDAVLDISDAQANIPATPNAATKASAARTNCGIGHVCDTFDAAAQSVSTTGDHAYQSPGPNDIRGPCPGLNAAANHNYLPRNGIASITQTITGLGELYGMSADLAGFLAAYSVIFDGDVPSTSWSIGGPFPKTLLGGLTGVPTGDGYSHNNYEGDTSITRCDSYINGGDAHSSSPTRFRYAWESGMDDDSYTLDKFSRLYAKNTHRSVQQNPYYFAPLFSTTLVSPAAYNFVINFMSNHSAAQPGGYLNGAMFKEWFGYKGTYPNFQWQKGQERIPENWYRRPLIQGYNAVDVFLDLISEFAAYPDTFRFGGNANGVNSYAGIDISNFTGGVYNAQTLFEGDNFGCFVFQTLEQGIPLYLQNGVNDVAEALSLIGKYYPDGWKKLTCPQLSHTDSSVFQPYAGNAYQPKPPTNGYIANC